MKDWSKALTGPITFEGKSFCFTGGMASLKRALAERETRARGGLTMGEVNTRLDYLVVGSIPSKAWAFGSYGQKINKAIELRNTHRTLRIVSDVRGTVNRHWMI